MTPNEARELLILLLTLFPENKYTLDELINMDTKKNPILKQLIAALASYLFYIKMVDKNTIATVLNKHFNTITNYVETTTIKNNRYYYTIIKTMELN